RGETLVQRRLETYRAKAANVDCRGYFGLSVAVRRQPESEEGFLSAQRMLQPSKGCPSRTRKATPVLLLADRARKGLCSELSDWSQPRPREGPRRHDEARLRALRHQSRPGNRSPSRAPFPPSSVPVRRVPTLCY